MPATSSRWGGRRAQALRRDVWERYGPACHLCGRDIGPGERWDVDHVQPLSRGGDPWRLSNMRPAHARCNRSRGAGAMRVWRA